MTIVFYGGRNMSKSFAVYGCLISVRERTTISIDKKALFQELPIEKFPL